VPVCGDGPHREVSVTAGTGLIQINVKYFKYVDYSHRFAT